MALFLLICADFVHAKSASASLDQSFAPFTSPLVIAHRGASCCRPEETLAAYALALRQGADFIETDLCSTGDGVLVCRHDCELSDTTDIGIRTEFSSRKRTRLVYDRNVTGWFTDDFTLAEIRTLRAVERLSQRTHAYDGLYQIITLDEFLQYAQALSKELQRYVGVYIELKHPELFREKHLPMEEKLLASLRDRGYGHACEVARTSGLIPTPGGPSTPAVCSVYIQSFSSSSLKRIHSLNPAYPLVQLIETADKYEEGTNHSYGSMVTDEGLLKIREYADVVGPHKSYIISVHSRVAQPPSDFVERCHDVGLKVHPYTFRDERTYLEGAYGGNPINEYIQFFRTGIDGVFTDFPATAISARDHQINGSQSGLGGLVFTIGVAVVLALGIGVVMVVSLWRRYQAQREDLPSPPPVRRRGRDIDAADAVELHSLVSHVQMEEGDSAQQEMRESDIEDGCVDVQVV